MNTFHALLALPLLALASCAAPSTPPAEPTPVAAPASLEQSSLATNAFWYYQDLDAAQRFYVETLGVELVADYQFAKILQLAPSSYLTLVRTPAGRDPSQPKTVALALLTEQLDAWFAHLSAAEVPMRYPYEGAREGSAHDGFVAVDPEGYLLEFERFNPHPENERLMPQLDALRPKPSAHPGLSIRATVLWLYYEGENIGRAREFYGQVLGLPERVDQGWAWVHQSSSSGFIGIVDGARGMHHATPESSVRVSFVVEDVDGWLERVRADGRVRLRSGEIELESGAARTLVGFDPAGYELEWDTFVEHPFNGQLLERLR